MGGWGPKQLRWVREYMRPQTETDQLHSHIITVFSGFSCRPDVSDINLTEGAFSKIIMFMSCPARLVRSVDLHIGSRK